MRSWRTRSIASLSGCRPRARHRSPAPPRRTGVVSRRGVVTRDERDGREDRTRAWPPVPAGAPMAWEKRGNKTYFYRSVFRDGKVKKIYYGAGPAGKLAADAD